MLTAHEKRQLLALLDKLPTTTPCVDCVNFDGGICTLAMERIPVDILPVGCHEWKFQELSPPF